ncbi:FRG domain-containing protein [Pararobbsia alpina]|jgi:hypothetical protein|uniref:FRG domain-containing protein n=1 Tax=Pararobbsia alpina TaxID=621374 RepID=UPI0039A44B45
METIGQQRLWSFIVGQADAVTVRCSDVRRGNGHFVNNFLELASKVAELQFRNRDHVLLFRGQRADHRNTQHNSTLKPTLFRARKGNPTPTELQQRFEVLEAAEAYLAEEYVNDGFLGMQRLQRQRIVRWAVLQHYEVCPTPLIDVTHSLRIAASFASHGAQTEAFLFVLGIPFLGGGLTASAEAGLQAVRLSSVCPPAALRPHVQEGYLLGEYPEMGGFKQKELYRHFEMDFGRRLIAKFWFNPQTFWTDANFPLVSETALYPPIEWDPLMQLAARVKARLEHTEA